MQMAHQRGLIDSPYPYVPGVLRLMREPANPKLQFIFGTNQGQEFPILKRSQRADQERSSDRNIEPFLIKTYIGHTLFVS